LFAALLQLLTHLLLRLFQLSAQVADHILLSFNDLSLVHHLLSQSFDLQSELPQELQRHLQHRSSILAATVSPLGRSVGVVRVTIRVFLFALSVPSVGFSSCRAASLTLVGGLTTRPIASLEATERGFHHDLGPHWLRHAGS
jgi:hypothetical protein